MGRTGSGKTTILEAICGLRTVAGGTIKLAGRIGFAPQDGALFTTMTVRDHLAFSLTVRRWAKADIDRRVTELVELLGIANILDRKPAGLSGGEKQRVSLGRALAFHPAILCMDEPLSALDDATRVEMYELLSTVRQHTGVTTLHITHSQSEADTLADQVLVLESGTIRSLAD
ncbi:UNVERIFIED_CONTAM: hypothetical protein GTU68_061907 [Idotea baltica]|nr:hypothetical protein [Idotea baltica]